MQTSPDAPTALQVGNFSGWAPVLLPGFMDHRLGRLGVCCAFGSYQDDLVVGHKQEAHLQQAKPGMQIVSQDSITVLAWRLCINDALTCPTSAQQSPMQMSSRCCYPLHVGVQAPAGMSVQPAGGEGHCFPTVPAAAPGATTTVDPARLQSAAQPLHQHVPAPGRAPVAAVK